MTDKQWIKILEHRLELRNTDIKIMVEYLLDHGCIGSLSNQDDDESTGEMAYQAALRFADFLEEKS